MGGLSDLSEDLLRSIARRLTVAVDRVRFGAVCKWWEFVAKSEQNYLPRRPPWLMLAENPTTAGCSKRGFVGLEEDEEVFKVDFQEGRGNRCVGSTGTWLITVDETLGMHLLNPLTRDHIELPPKSMFGRIYSKPKGYGGEDLTRFNLHHRNAVIKKAVLRWLPPDHHRRQKEQDFIVIVIYFPANLLAFARRGSKSWTAIQNDGYPTSFSDVIFYNAKGKFYGVNHNGLVMEIDIDVDGGGPKEPKTIQVFGPLIRNDTRAVSDYLVECSGHLLQVVKFVQNYETTRFEVYAVDFANRKPSELRSLGHYSLFIGDNTSVALLADSFSTFSGNCIYFTNDYILRGGIKRGKDMGVFNMESGTIKPHCKRVSVSYFSPPLWIIPSNFTC